MTPGERIRAERKRQGWSQEKVARLAGLSYRTIHAAETSTVKTSTLRQIVEALDLSWDEFSEDVPA